MIKLKEFTFNPFQVNTYLLNNEEKECIIIDPACSNQEEEKVLADYIQEQELNPIMLINTHCHIDHITGNQFVYDTWGLKPVIHRKGLPILESSSEQALFLGFPATKGPAPEQFLQDNEKIHLGNSSIEVRYTPGHADGSICLILHDERFIISGDVLFAGSVGRADLPTGDMALLQKSIEEKLLSLPDDFTVYPGHGPSTTIREEVNGNPYL
mgnify:CR=1 FL=1